MLEALWKVCQVFVNVRAHKGPKNALAPVALAIVVLALGACGGASAAAPQREPTPAPPVSEVQPPPPSKPSKPAQTSPPPPAPPALPKPLLQANLGPMTPTGWNGPLIVAPAPGAFASAAELREETVYVSWAVTNTGPEEISAPFFVDLALDGVPVERWSAPGLKQGATLEVRDWDGLLGRARLTPGEHTLTLMVDPTNLINEEDRENNRFALPFVWARPPTEEASATVRERLPNLAPYVPQGWDAPIRIVAREAPSSGGSLRVQAAYKNIGLSSISRFFQVHLYLDDVLVAKFGERSLIAREGVVTPEWGGLDQVVRLKPGRHTLTLVLDPTDLVQEANEADNRFALPFRWGPGLPSAPTPSPDPPAADPQGLVAFTPPGWDAPIVATNTPGELAVAGALTIAQPTYVHWAAKNLGEAIQRPYAIELRLDGALVAAWPRTRLGAGQLDAVLDWPLASAGSLSPGPHTLELLVRFSVSEGATAGGIALAHRTLSWASGDPVERPPIRYTRQELQERLAKLQGLTSWTGPTGNAPAEASSQAVLAVADAVYYHLLGRSLRDEPLAIHFFSDEEYVQWVALECQDTLGQLSAELQGAFREQCARLAGFGGYTAYWRGRYHIVLRTQQPPLQLLGALAHELGHFRQAQLRPELGRGAWSLEAQALREAQAYAYQTHFLRALEGVTGQALLLYPKLEGYERFVTERIGGLAREQQTDEHARGRLLVWLAVLTDPSLRHVRNVLLTQRALTEEAARELFTYLVQLRPQDASSYVPGRFRELPTQLPAIQSLALARLLPGLPYWTEGSPFLREVGLLLP